MRDFVDDFGGKGNTTTDNVMAFAALQTAIDGGLKGDIVFRANRSTAGTTISTGTYKVTSANPVVVKNNYTRLIFEPGARIRWEPSGAGTCVKFENPSGTLLHCGFENLEINCPTNTGFERIGVDIHDVRYSRFIGYRTTNFAGSTSTALKVRGRDRLIFMDLNLQAERPIWLASNADREPGATGKDLDHSQFFNGNLIPVTPPNPAVYIEPGYVLRNSGFVGEWAFAGGPIQWIDGATVPRRESNHFYVSCGARFEQFADLGPVTEDTFAIDIQKHSSALLTDLQLDSIMLAVSAGNDWSGLRATGVSRTSMRHCVYRGGGTAVAGNGAVQTIQCSLEGL
jgi:hypothetical protein